MDEAFRTIESDPAKLRDEIALRDREIERQRRANSIKRDALRLKRFTVLLAFAALVVVGGSAALVTNIVMTQTNDRLLLLERERAANERTLAERQLELNKALAIAQVESESLQRFGERSLDQDLQTRADMAAYFAEIASNDEVKQRWTEIKTYMESQRAERTEQLKLVQAAISKNQKLYIAAVNEIVTSQGSLATGDSQLSHLDSELAALRADAARLRRDLMAPAGRGDRRAEMIGPEAPVPLSPPDGAVLGSFPRKATLSWSEVPEAASYTLEVDCFDCCAKDQWCSDVGEDYLTLPHLMVNRMTFDFVGPQPGRWRVWAVSHGGQDGDKTGWSKFEFAE